MTHVQELSQMELLSEFISQQAGSLVSYASLAKMIRVSADTVRRWTKILRSMYFHFEIRPWTKNITRSLLKEPKYYLWDWASVPEEGSRFENFVASHLLKAVHFWTDSGLGLFELYFIRDKEKREVDFLIVKDKKAWCLIEAKLSPNEPLSPHLKRFQDMTKAKHAFQVVANLDFVKVNCFDYTTPTIVPAKTFLAQLI